MRSFGGPPAGRRAGAVALTLAIAAAGAAAASGAGLPAAALLGASVVVSLAALAGLPVDVPDRLRDAAFAVIGCSLGSGFTPEFLHDVMRWPASVAGVCLVMLGVMAATSWLLVRFFGQTAGDAALATSPGALSVAISLALTRGANPQIVMVFQTLRLILITLTVPLAIVAIEGRSGGASGAAAAVKEGVALPAAAAMLAAGAALGVLGARLRVPAAFMLGGMAVSAALHLAGVVTGPFPPALTFAGFVVTGAVIGARFSRIERQALRRLAVAAAASTALALAISALAAWPVARLLDMPFGQAWVAYAPGGVEAMAAIGLALDYDGAFIATHHLARILMLAFLLPLIFARLDR